MYLGVIRYDTIEEFNVALTVWSQVRS